MDKITDSSRKISGVLVVAAIAMMVSPVVAHEPTDWNDSKVHVLVDKEGSGGSMGMFTVEQPKPGGPARHVHEDAGEAFYLLQGEAEFMKDGKLTVLKEGEAAFVPKGMEHSFRILGEDGGKLLVIVTPAGFEGFFEATKHLKIPADLPEIEKISKEYGQVFTGPPLSAE